MLDSGLTGILRKEDYSDDWKHIRKLSDRLKEGDILTCKIKSILKDRDRDIVYLVCKDSEMRKSRYTDEYYYEGQENLQSEQEKAQKRKELAEKHFQPRRIFYPHFQNITVNEAVEVCVTSDVCSFVFKYLCVWLLGKATSCIHEEFMLLKTL